MNNKTWQAINQWTWKSCKYKQELEIDTKTDEGTSLVLQTNGGPLHQAPLESDASKLYSLITERIHSKAMPLSRDARAHTYIKNRRGGLWYPFPFGSIGVSTSPNPNKIIC